MPYMIIIGIIAVAIAALVGGEGMVILLGVVGLIVWFFISNVRHTSSLFRKRRK